MQSVSQKVYLFDLNSRATGRSLSLIPNQRNCYRTTTRTCKIVACSFSDRNGIEGENKQILSSFASRSHTYALLKQQMEVAAKSEDYKEAARIRDSLKVFEKEEPVLCLLRALKEAVADERFECHDQEPAVEYIRHLHVTIYIMHGIKDANPYVGRLRPTGDGDYITDLDLRIDAAKYRDELKLVAPHALLKCSSDATTLGVRVQVRSVYIEDRSQPSKQQYFFAYRIRVTNNSVRPVQLLRRHWIVTDANGRSENVWGIGVIGQQPVILPQTGFEYSSACPLSTPSGTMEGDFEMKYTDKVGASTFNVAIAPFSLSIVGDDSDV